MLGLTAIETRTLAWVLAFAAVLGCAGWVLHEVKAHDHAVASAAVSQCKADQVLADQAEEQRRLAAQQEVDNESQRMVARARADAVRLAGAPRVLQPVVAAILASCPAGAVAVGSAAASQPDLRPDVFGEVEDRLRGLAAEADARGVAGASCVEQYGAMSR